MIASIRDKINVVQGWIAAVDVIGPIVSAALTELVVEVKANLTTWYNAEQQANLGTAYNRLMATEQLPENPVAPPKIGGSERHDQGLIFNLLPR